MRHVQRNQNGLFFIQLSSTFFYDILIFCDESIDDSIHLKYILELYWKALGMTINEAYVRICNDDLYGISVKYNLKE